MATSPITTITAAAIDQRSHASARRWSRSSCSRCASMLSSRRRWNCALQCGHKTSCPSISAGVSSSCPLGHGMCRIRGSASNFGGSAGGGTANWVAGAGLTTSFTAGWPSEPRKDPSAASCGGGSGGLSAPGDGGTACSGSMGYDGATTVGMINSTPHCGHCVCMPMCASSPCKRCPCGQRNWNGMLNSFQVRLMFDFMPGLGRSTIMLYKRRSSQTP